MAIQFVYHVTKGSNTYDAHQIKSYIDTITRLFWALEDRTKLLLRDFELKCVQIGHLDKRAK